MPKPTLRPKHVTINISPKLLAEYKERLKRVHAAHSEGAKDWDTYYEEVGEILAGDPPLYMAGGYATDREFIQQELKEDSGALYRNVRVAKYATAEEIDLFTPSVLSGAITYVETKNGGPLKGATPIKFQALKLKLKSDGKIVSRLLKDCSVQDVRAAIALVKGKAAKDQKSSPTANAIGSLLKTAKAKGTTFHVNQKTVVLHVPLEELSKVGAVLAKFKPIK